MYIALLFYLRMNQLKNLKYQTMLVQGKLIPDIQNTTNTNINSALETEKTDKPATWNKLPRSDKAMCLNTYVSNFLSAEYELNDAEVVATKEYLRSSIDRKKLQKNKDVVFTNGKLTAVNGLVFNKQTRKFTIKDTEKKQSTLKNLAPTKKKQNQIIINP
jgi:hypothetical protein